MDISTALVRNLITCIVGSILASTPLLGQECIGDCDGDGEVLVNELTTGVGIALGNRSLDDCPEFDVNKGGAVSIAELIQAVNRSLLDCPVHLFPSSALYPGRKFPAGASPFSGAAPLSVAVADLDADGVRDLVTANGEVNDVSVLLGVGDGTFADAKLYGAGEYTSSVAVADLNADESTRSDHRQQPLRRCVGAPGRGRRLL